MVSTVIEFNRSELRKLGKRSGKFISEFFQAGKLKGPAGKKVTVPIIPVLKFAGGPGFMIYRIPATFDQRSVKDAVTRFVQARTRGLVPQPISINELKKAAREGRITPEGKVIIEPETVKTIEAVQKPIPPSIEKAPLIRSLTPSERRAAVLGLPRDVREEASDILRLTPAEIRADPRLREAFGVIVNPSVIRDERDLAEKIREGVKALGIFPPTRTEDTASQVLKSAAFAVATLPASIIETPRSLFGFGQEIARKGPVEAAQEVAEPFIEDPFRQVSAFVAETAILIGGGAALARAAAARAAAARAAAAKTQPIPKGKFKTKTVKSVTRERILEEEILSDIPSAAEQFVKTTAEAIIKPRKRPRPSRLTTEDLLQSTEETLKEVFVLDIGPKGTVAKVKRLKQVTKPVIEERIVEKAPPTDPFFFIEAGSVRQVNTFVERGIAGRISKIRAREIDVFFPQEFPRPGKVFRGKFRKRPRDLTAAVDDDIAAAISVDAGARAGIFERGPPTRPTKKPSPRPVLKKPPARRLRPQEIVFDVEELVDTIPAVRPGQIPGLSRTELNVLYSVFGVSFATQAARQQQQRTVQAQREKQIQKQKPVSDVINDILTTPIVTSITATGEIQRRRLDTPFLLDIIFDTPRPGPGIRTRPPPPKPPRRSVPFFEIPFLEPITQPRRVGEKPKKVSREFEFLPTLLGLELQLQQFEPGFLTGLEPRGILRRRRKR